MRSVRTLTILAVSAFAMGCSVTHPVRVLDEGATRVTASVGGPLIPYHGATIPVPYLTAGAARGITSTRTAFGDVHLLMGTFGVLGANGGMAWKVRNQEGPRPEVTLLGQAYLFTDLHSMSTARLFPDAAAVASYQLGDTWLTYGSVDIMGDPWQKRFLLTPALGGQWEAWSGIRLQLEMKWMAANIDTRHGIFEGRTSLAGHGAVGLFLGAGYDL